MSTWDEYVNVWMCGLCMYVSHLLQQPRSQALASQLTVQLCRVAAAAGRTAVHRQHLHKDLGRPCALAQEEAVDGAAATSEPLHLLKPAAPISSVLWESGGQRPLLIPCVQHAWWKGTPVKAQLAGAWY